MILACCELAGRSGHDAGRDLLKKLWQENVGEEMPEIRVTDRGKPYFEGEKWHFSISHTKRHAFCALSEGPIGIDAEECDRKIDPKLAEKILSPGEKARYDASADKGAALLRLWVLKEAAVKLSGQGLRGYPNDTDFDPGDPRIMEVNGCFVAILEAAVEQEK